MQCWMDVAFLPIVKMCSWCFVLLNSVTLQSAGGKTNHFASGAWLGVNVVHPMQLDHRLPSICNCTSRRTHWSQSTDRILLLETTILLQSDTSPAHRSVPHYASPKLAGLTKICSLNSWRQLGLSAMGEGTQSRWAGGSEEVTISGRRMVKRC